jgi:hypothetical protein
MFNTVETTSGREREKIEEREVVGAEWLEVPKPNKDIMMNKMKGRRNRETGKILGV